MYKIGDKELRSNYVVSKKDNVEDVIKQITEVADQLSDFKPQLSQTLTQLFNKWNKDGDVSPDDTFTAE